MFSTEIIKNIITSWFSHVMHYGAMPIKVIVCYFLRNPLSGPGITQITLVSSNVEHVTT